MRVLFMGTPDFAVPTLEALLQSRHEVVAVVCQPDKPSGRGHKLKAPPVKQRAEERGIAVLQPQRIKSRDGSRQREFADELKHYRPDIGVVVAYGKILPPEVLNAPARGCLNVHASLLPKFRGAAPINWAIARGETETGVTIMQMDEGMDTGDVLAQESVEILSDDDAQSLSNMLSITGAQLLVRVLDEIEAGNPPKATPQAQMGEPTYAPPLQKEDGWIDWSRTRDEIICHINGMTPWPGAFARMNGSETLKILKAEPWDHSAPSARADDEPGDVVGTIKGRGFLVRAGAEPREAAHLLVTRVKPANKGAMDAWSAVNGGYVDTKTSFENPPRDGE